MVKIMTMAHAHASFSFGLDLSKQLTLTKEELDDILLPVGFAYVLSPNRIKRADESFLSRQVHKRKSIRWPNLCMEVGYSDLPMKLERDARWWIGELGG